MKYSVLLVLVPVALSFIGCGGGSSTTNAPTITRSSITTFPGNSSGGTGPLIAAGGHVETSVIFATSPAIDPNSVLLNVVDGTGKSLFGGPQHMGLSTGGNPSAFGYAFNVPANTSHQAQVYTFTVTATDTSGHAIKLPATIGNETVPGS
jgi:hypothetical protein